MEAVFAAGILMGVILITKGALTGNVMMVVFGVICLVSNLVSLCVCKG
jgi:hypothetical protein|nr:MAG TPA: hypothetical protein [Caudoviricetes sp.]